MPETISHIFCFKQCKIYNEKDLFLKDAVVNNWIRKFILIYLVILFFSRKSFYSLIFIIYNVEASNLRMMFSTNIFMQQM